MRQVTTVPSKVTGVMARQRKSATEQQPSWTTAKFGSQGFRVERDASTKDKLEAGQGLKVVRRSLQALPLLGGIPHVFDCWSSLGFRL